MTEPTNPSKNFDKWYSVHSTEHNSKRRDRYKNDPEYRERVRERARVNAAKRRAEAKGKVTREYKGETVVVHRIGEVAKACGVTADTIKRREEQGEIPACLFEGTHRVYTINQLELLQQYFKDEIDREALSADWGKPWY